MSITLTATEARVHFGEMLRKLESDTDIVIEKNGSRVGILVSPRRYDELSGTSDAIDWWEQACQSRNSVISWFGDSPLPDIDELINVGHDDE